MKKQNDHFRTAGSLTISRYKDGACVWRSERMANRVVMGATGYGRNLVARQLAGDTVYPIVIDSASLGTDNTAAADAQTDLITPTVTLIPITNKTAVDDVVSVDVFVADANLPNDTYDEFGVFCDGRMFARIVISPAYTKGAGEDTLFSYELTLTA